MNSPVRGRAAKRFNFRFTVQGRGQFPLDMLRYDRCWPRGETDANVAQSSSERAVGEARLVELTATDRPSYWTPTEGRWRSFGWVVASVEREEV